MCGETFTFQELDLQEQELRRRLSEIDDIRYAMLHDPAFNFSLLSQPTDSAPAVYIDVNFHRRIWADAIYEGVLTLRADGAIDYCNARFAELVAQPVAALIGISFHTWVIADEQPTIQAILAQALDHRAEGEFHLRPSHGAPSCVHLAFCPFDSDDFSGVCIVVTDITEQKKIKDDLQYVSTHDALTGLYNQNYFYTELVRLERSRAYPMSVGFIDLDGMRAVNENMGHAVGDELLKRATSVLQSVFRAEDIVARVGGDEFAILLPNTDAVMTQQIINRVKNKLAVHNEIHRSPELSFSIGVATAEKGQSLAEALKQADQSMYQDKHSHHDLVNFPTGIHTSVASVIDAARNRQFTKAAQSVG